MHRPPSTKQKIQPHSACYLLQAEFESADQPAQVVVPPVVLGVQVELHHLFLELLEALLPLASADQLTFVYGKNTTHKTKHKT